MQQGNILTRQWKGIVVDNEDPLRLGRIKCDVLGLFSVGEEGDATTLPYCYPHLSPGLGGNADSSGFAVPEVGTELTIEFPFRDVYFPVYTGRWQNGLTHQVEYDEDYPESYGFRDSSGNIFKTNKQKNFTEFLHSSGSSIRFEANGDIVFNTKGRVRMASDDQKTEFAWDMNTGGEDHRPKTGGKTQGQTHEVEVSELTENLQTKVTNIQGSKENNIDGGYKEQVGADKAENVVGNRVLNVGGDSTELRSGNTEVTYGLGKKETVVAGEILQEILLGNYKINLTAGNIALGTKAGTVDLGNLLGKLSVDVAGNSTLEGLITTIQGLVQADIKAPLVNLGPAPTGPVVTQITSPLIDLITGAPQIGVPTVLA